jgi:hypothetical protein
MKSLGYGYSRSWQILRQHANEYASQHGIEYQSIGIDALLTRIQNYIPPPPVIISPTFTSPTFNIDHPTTPSDVLLHPTVPELRIPKRYDQSLVYRQRIERIESEARLLRRRLQELESEHKRMVAIIEDLNIKKDQQKIRSKIQPQQLLQLPIVHNTLMKLESLNDTIDEYGLDAPDFDDLELANTYLDPEPPQHTPQPKDSFNPSSYAEFVRVRTDQVKSKERESLHRRFQYLDEHPFEYVVDLSDIQNRDLITPLFKSFMLKHIANHAFVSKIQFR